MIKPTTMRELKYPCTCSSSIERFRCKENCDHVTQKQLVKIKPTTMIQKEFPCTCSSNAERLHCKELCDGKTQRQWVEEKWIVFREFDTENEAKEYAEFFGLTKFIWKIEKR